MAILKPVADFEFHEDYDSAEISIADGLYNGKKKFNAIKDSIVRFRDIETSRHPMAAQMRAKRLATVKNEALLPGFIDYLTAATCLQPLNIQVEAGAKADWWYQFGDKLGPLAAKALTHANVFGRAFIMVQFPRVDKEFSNLQDQKESGALDASLTLVEARQVEQWKLAEDGVLEFARVYYCEKETNPELPTLRHRHCWVVMDKQTIKEYEVIKEYDPQKKQIPDLDREKDVAVLVYEGTHGLGACPLVPIFPQVPAMDRLRDIAEQHINRVVAHEYGLDNACYQILYVASDKKMKDIYLSESTIPQLEKGGAFGVAGPSAVPFDKSENDIERLGKAMPASLQIGSLRTTTEMGNTSRMSEKARVHEFGSVAALLNSYAYMMKEVFKKVIKLVKAGRNEEIEPTLTGMDRFHIVEEMQAVDFMKALLELGIPPTAEKYLKGQIVQAATSSAPPATRQKIDEELAAMESTLIELDKTDAGPQPENIDKSKKDSDTSAS